MHLRADEIGPPALQRGGIARFGGHEFGHLVDQDGQLLQTLDLAVQKVEGRTRAKLQLRTHDGAGEIGGGIVKIDQGDAEMTARGIKMFVKSLHGRTSKLRKET